MCLNPVDLIRYVASNQIECDGQLLCKTYRFTAGNKVRTRASNGIFYNIGDERGEEKTMTQVRLSQQAANDGSGVLPT